MGMIIKNKTQYSSSSIIVELTQAEYDALSTQEKNSNVFYCITDVNGDDQSFQPIIYSTEEREIGVWTDGKPLYQKTFIFTGTYSGSMTIGNINVSNIDALIISECTGHTADGTWRNISFAHMDASNNSGLFIKTNGDVDIRCGSGVSGQYAYDKIQFNIRYTKTTDTPGSGTWTPQGVPAVHYSTDEQVVGKWIDGSTLYEQTIYVENPTKGSISGYYYYNAFLTAIDIDFATLLNATIYDATDGRWLDLPYERIISSEAIHIQGMVIEDHSYQFQVFFQTNQSYNITKMIATIRYTKTTS